MQYFKICVSSRVVASVLSNPNGGFRSHINRVWSNPEAMALWVELVYGQNDDIDFSDLLWESIEEGRVNETSLANEGGWQRAARCGRTAAVEHFRE